MSFLLACFPHSRRSAAAIFIYSGLGVVFKGGNKALSRALVSNGEFGRIQLHWLHTFSCSAKSIWLSARFISSRNVKLEEFLYSKISPTIRGDKLHNQIPGQKSACSFHYSFPINKKSAVWLFPSPRGICFYRFFLGIQRHFPTLLLLLVLPR